MVSEAHPPAARDDHDQFCTTEGWELKRGATGRPVRHHRTYTLRLWDRRILRTRISRPVNSTQYAASLWAHILRHQLEVEADAFWACVRNRLLPDRGEPTAPDLSKAVPLYLFRALQGLGVSQNEILALDAAGAATLHARLLTEAQDADQGD